MKGYFAKLADRAALANASVRSPASSAIGADPFENAAPLPAAPPSIEPGRRMQTLEPLSLLRNNQPQDIEPASNQSNIDIPPQLLPDTPAFSEMLQPPSAEMNPIAERVVKNPSDFEQREVEPMTIQRPVLAPDTPLRLQSPIQKPPALSQPFTGSDSEEEQPLTQNRAAEERLDDLEQQQAMLLRKADAFMGRLLERRQESPDARESETEPEAPSALEPKVQLEPSHRAQSVPAPARPSREDSDRPSLVIGKLTVEVVPPAPPSNDSKTKVVVTRTGRSRPGGLISSRRFGLGQF
jgi:hypothetical protein